MQRIMIAGTGSGCGKTTVTCAVLQTLAGRGKRIVSFKCGPDYIDPMFHSRIIGLRARNLDGYFMDNATLQYLLRRGCEGMDMAVMEGVMGYYDGRGMEDTASSYALARDTATPAVLVMSCRGMSRSIQAQLYGYVTYKPDSGIRGVIFNELPASLYPAMAEYCKRLGLKPLGFLPEMDGISPGSRHLGLVTADEVPDFKRRMQELARVAEKYLDIGGLLGLASQAGPLAPGSSGLALAAGPPAPDAAADASAAPAPSARPLRIAVARDLAFCFYYEENLMLLRDLGCELIEFSPLRDETPPREICGMLLGGGYPELYGRELEQNESMRDGIRRLVTGGLPVHAECGGFLYLHRTLRAPDGAEWRMAGVLDAECHFTDKLQHFGYVEMTACKDNVLCGTGESIRAHEFHRYVSTAEPDTFQIKKNGACWTGYVSPYRLAAGFAHINYFANPSFAVHFVEQCRRYRDHPLGA